MTGLGMSRYVLEWGLILAACCVPALLLPASVVASEHRLPIVFGVSAAGVAELVVYVAVGRAMIAQPSRVIRRWILSVLGKLVFFGIGSAVAAVVREDALLPFMLALVSSFLIFSFHQVYRLVKISGDT